MAHVYDANRIWRDKESLLRYGVPNSSAYSSLWGEVTSWSSTRIPTKLQWNERKFFHIPCPLRRVNMIPYTNFLGMHDSSVLSCFPSSMDIPLPYPRHSYHLGPLIHPKSDYSVSKVVQPFFSKGLWSCAKFIIQNSLKNNRPQLGTFSCFLHYLDVSHTY